MKEINFKWFYLLIIAVTLFLGNCISNNHSLKKAIKNSKMEKLYNSNAELNRLYSKENWSKIYDKLLESKQANVRKYALKSRKTFIVEIERIHLWPTSINLETIDLHLDGNEAMSSNLRKAKVLFYPFRTANDTAFHFWKYHEKNWYLIDFGRAVISERWKKILEMKKEE